MALELAELRSFLLLCEHRHFGRTATALHISQPALSKQIQRLEERLGGALLIRRSGGMHLTPAGALLQQRARSLIADADAAEQITRLALHGDAGVLRVGFGVAVLARGLPEIILRFRRRYPAVHLSVKNMSTSDQLQALADRTIDVGFVRLPVSTDDIEAVPVLNERLMIVLGKHHADVPDGLPALRDAPFILPCRADSVSFYDHVVRTCKAAGFVPKVVQETDVFFTALNLVRAGLGVSIAPSAIQLMRVPQIRFAETCIPEAEWSIGIAWNRCLGNSPVVTKFRSMAERYLSATVR